MILKVCKKCRIEKPLENFRVDRGYVRGECRACEAALRKEHYDKDPERYCEIARRWSRENSEKRNATKRQWRKDNPGYHRPYSNFYRYGVTEERYKEMLDSQGGACAICGGIKRLGVDHCHNSKKVRGILCMHCNTAIGHLKDSTELFQKAIQYLQKSS